MPRLLAFDLDGTLVRTEELKARSYAWAARELRPEIDTDAVEVAYGHLVGFSREQISRSLVERFNLAPEARAYASGDEPWRVYVGLRLERYRAMLADGDLIRSHTWPEAIALLEEARDLAERVALVTTSECWAADAILDALDVRSRFDIVVTADDVPAVKPDPAGYRLALSRMDVSAERSLAIEDSPSGVRAALAAGIRPLAVPTPYTRDRIAGMATSGELDAASVIAPEALRLAARQRLELATSSAR